MISTRNFGILSDGSIATLYMMKNGNGVEAFVCSFGAAVVSIFIPSKQGGKKDIVLGFSCAKEYEEQHSNFGVTIGRYANRIRGGHFELNGNRYTLCCNSGPNHIHGGKNGFAKKNWSGEIQGNTLVLTYISLDGEEGYPGELHTQTMYTLTEQNVLEIAYFAWCVEKDTIINLTNHTYFNLAGHKQGHAIDQMLQIQSDFYTGIDQDKAADGTIRSVAGSAFDFRQAKRIGAEIDADDDQLQKGNGYDHNFVLKKTERRGLEFAARLIDPQSKTCLEISTTLPGIQLYTGNYLSGTEVGKEHTRYQRRAGICLEPQFFPNAMEHTHFPSPVLRVGEKYHEVTRYRFGFCV